MTTNGLLPIDFCIWADYWDLFEQNGLNGDNGHRLHNFLASPVLILGSGQGLMSAHFMRAGYRVCSVDKSARMAAYAARRRGVSTVVCDALLLRLPHHFQAVIVSTGLINLRSLGQGLLPPLLETIKWHLAPGGRLVLSYFRVTPWTHTAQQLGLYGRPSNNVILWHAGGDLVYAEQLFAAHLNDPPVVRQAFDQQRTKLLSQMSSILATGRRYVELHKEPPEKFIAYHSGYYPFPLSRDDESKIREALTEHQMILLSVLSTNDGDTTILVYERT